MNCLEILEIETSVRGRCLALMSSQGTASGLVIGFHGYGERAEHLMEHLEKTLGGLSWHCCCVEALHHFYGRSGSVGASWMTKLNRNQRIIENLSYVRAVETVLPDKYTTSACKVYLGFSQGGAMAYRAAYSEGAKARAVVAVGSDVPPDLEILSAAHCGIVLMCRGTRDKRYSKEQFGSDAARLEEAGIDVRTFEFDGGHEWTEELRARIRTFLIELGSGEGRSV